MQSYIERSRQIRNLSMPPENKEHFYGQFLSLIHILSRSGRKRSLTRLKP